MFEIKSSKLAVDRTTGPTKDFAEKMIKDHSKTTAQLEAAAMKAITKLSQFIIVLRNIHSSEVEPLDNPFFLLAYYPGALDHFASYGGMQRCRGFISMRMMAKTTPKIAMDLSAKTSKRRDIVLPQEFSEVARVPAGADRRDMIAAARGKDSKFVFTAKL